MMIGMEVVQDRDFCYLSFAQAIATESWTETKFH
jgi:hypothetical protein